MQGVFLFLKTKKMKLKNVVSFFFLLVMFLVPFVAIPIVKNQPNPLGYAENDAESVILELWNVDTFESGSVGKSEFLQKVAMQFKQQNNQVYVIVKNLTEAQAKQLIEGNQKPDMVSFGIGAGELFLPFLSQVDAPEVNSFFLHYGKKDGKQLCVPWCMGAYLLCSLCGADVNNINSWISVDKKNFVGFGGQNNAAVLALSENKSEFKLNQKILYEKSLDENFSQYDAYKDFVSKKFDILLGTQKDYVRLLNRIQKGTEQCCFRFLGGFSDLMQWFGVLNTDGATMAAAKSFLSFLLSSSIQNQLSEICMFSPTDEAVYATDIRFSEFEKTQKRISKSLNAFLSKTEVLGERKKAVSNLFY